MSHLTIAYMTNRKDCCIQWFFDSLRREIKHHGAELDYSIVIVDYWANEPLRKEQFKDWSKTHWQNFHCDGYHHVTPKPSVWQGPHRLTKEDWFSASNARNTALCLAEDFGKGGAIVYVDDLSVLLPGWLSSVRDAMSNNYIVCGAYRKVKNLVVENGDVKSFTQFSDDNRLQYAHNDLTPCGGNWLYGCSVAGPVESFLSVNGWPEDLCDGMGFEDCCMGMVLANAGHQLIYDRRMMTYESEEHHHIPGAQFRKEDWHIGSDGKPVKGGNGATDKSHAVLNIAMASKRFPNSYDIRELRAKVLAGESFPIPQSPRHEWFTKQPLEEL
jgi:hypothetical protein